jgi:hypothetical protein
MKVPKKILEALEKRMSYALKLQEKCSIVDNFLHKNNIETENFDSWGGAEIYVNPYASYLRVKKDIEEA